METPRLILERGPQQLEAWGPAEINLPKHGKAWEAVLPVSCLWGGPQGGDPLVCQVRRAGQATHEDEQVRFQSLLLGRKASCVPRLCLARAVCVGVGGLDMESESACICLPSPFWACA